MPFFRFPSAPAIGLGLFAAGLLTGEHAGPVVTIAVAAGALAALGLGRRPIAAGVVLLGLGHGALARHLDLGRCAAVLPAGDLAVTGTVLEPAGPGRIGRLAPAGACRGAVSFLNQTSDTLWAGSRGDIRGRWTSRPAGWGPRDGLLAIQSAPALAMAPSTIERGRNWLARTIARYYGSRAGMIDALIAGSRGTIEPGLAKAFAGSGLVHLLSISGFHVGLIWAWIVLVLGLARFRRRQPAAAVIVIGYVWWLGLPAPAVRATVLALVGAWSRARQRNPGAGPLFAVSALAVLVVDPWAVVDLGAWLSVGSLWGATAAVRWSDRAIGSGAFWRVISGSVGATLATAPITALSFGTVALAGIALNPVAIPLAGAAVPAVIASLVAAPFWPALAGSLAAGGGALLALLEAIAVRGAALPGASLTFDAGWPAALAAAAVVAAAVLIFGGRPTGREATRRVVWTAAVASAAPLLAGLVRFPRTASDLTLHFLDVGQGDAALVETGAGHWVLIDAGPSDERGNAGARTIVPFLKRAGVTRLEAVVLSHGHRDHYGGLLSVVAAVPVGRVMEPARLVPDPGYLELLDGLADAGVAWEPIRAGTVFEVDDVRFRAIHPDTAWSGWGDDLNEDSAVMVVERGAFSAVFSGDAGAVAEPALAAKIGTVEVLKVGHHGSRTATTAEWLARLRPEAAVISVGTNRYGHPAPETIARLAAAKVPVWRTDRDGPITIRVRGGTMRVEGRDRSEVLPVQ